MMAAIYLIIAGGFGGILALVIGLAGGVVGLLGMRREKTSMRKAGLILALLALVVGILGLIAGLSATATHVEQLRVEGLNPDVALYTQEVGVWESRTALFWGIIGLLPGLFLWWGGRPFKVKS
jgi:hypothetical protein